MLPLVDKQTILNAILNISSSLNEFQIHFDNSSFSAFRTRALSTTKTCDDYSWDAS